MTKEQAITLLHALVGRINPLICVREETQVYGDGGKVTRYEVYAHGYNYHNGITWLAAIARLEQEILEKGAKENGTRKDLETH